LNKNSFIILLQLAVILTLIWFLWYPTDNNTALKATPESSQNFNENQYRQVLEHLDKLDNKVSQLSSHRLQLEDRITQLENRSTPSAEKNISTEYSDINTPPAHSDADTSDIPIQQKLINQGLTVQTVNMLQKYIDNKRLQRLNLRDQAIREGWQDTDEYIEKMNALGDAAYGLKQEFGEEVYDQYLYASGRPNRVVVREIINGSVAQSAGLQPGDIITRYADELIYSMNDLRQATTRGTSGESILLEYMRDDQPYSATITRGPLGISMDFAHIAPR
jgi:C-terminal processing protease CtpA/Prc